MSNAPDGYKGEWEGLTPEIQQLIRQIYEVAAAIEGDDTPHEIVFKFYELQDEAERLQFWEKAKLAARGRA